MGPSAAGAKCDLRTLVEPVMVRGSVTLLYFPLTQRVVSQFQEMSSEQGGEGHCGALCKARHPTVLALPGHVALCVICWKGSRAGNNQVLSAHLRPQVIFVGFFSQLRLCLQIVWLFDYVTSFA